MLAVVALVDRAKVVSLKSHNTNVTSFLGAQRYEGSPNSPPAAVCSRIRIVFRIGRKRAKLLFLLIYWGKYMGMEAQIVLVPA